MVQRLFILTLVFALSSCSSSASKENSWHYAEQVNETLNVKGKSYQIIDSETENLLVVKATKTSFKLDPLQDTQAWERLSFYYQFYLASSQNLKKDQLEVKSTEGNFEYYISRKYNEDLSANYLIKVIDLRIKQITEESKLKAKNLARFLKDGILDQNLI